MLKNIFGRIWAVWGIILFVATMLLFTIPFLLIKLIPEPKRTVRFIRFSKVWMQIFLNGIGCPITVKGKEHFANGENFIVVCNHNSFMDVPVSCPFIPGGNKTIAKVEIAKVPLFGMIYKMGSVLVNRKSEKSRRDSYFKMKDVLASGLHMAIYPEGTRNMTGEPLKTFHDGAFKLSVETGKRMIPTLLFNTRTVLPPEKTFFLWPHKLEMHFLSPESADPGATSSALLKEKVFRVMYQYYSENAKPD
ncbi:MAG: lysophospholipid acyltransferase family protein [Chitinophagaceae bacterium]